jgi:hypothetical protein
MLLFLTSVFYALFTVLYKRVACGGVERFVA